MWNTAFRRRVKSVFHIDDGVQCQHDVSFDAEQFRGAVDLRPFLGNWRRSAVWWSKVT